MIYARTYGLPVPRDFCYLPTEQSLEWMQTNAASYSGVESLLMAQVAYWRADLLHLNQFCYGALPTSLPKVIVAHSDVISWSLACRGAMPGDSAWFRHYVEVVSCGLAEAQAIVAPTRWMLKAVCEHWRVPSRRVVIANGRDVPAGDWHRRRKLQAATIGRVWDEGKNIRLLEEVDSPMPLLVGGEISLGDEPPFTSSRLHLLGQLSEEAALRLFAESSIYIATSRYEPFGLAPLEAALSGCAIVAYDIASLREVWGKSALYFGTAGELSQVLHTLHADAELLSRAAGKAYARACAFYSRETMIDKYIALYAQVGAPASTANEHEAPAHYVS